MSFTWAGVQHAYFDHPYNETLNNERAVEVPAAQWFLSGREGEGLEVGNVLSHYGVHKPRRIVDLHEQGEGVENIDVFEVEGEFPWIVTISTMEHVGWDDDRDPVAALEAIDHLRDLLTDDGAMFLTIPLGWHAILDLAIRDNWLEPTIAATYSWADGEWEQVDDGTWRPYDHEHSHANAVWIAEVPKDRTPR